MRGKNVKIVYNFGANVAFIVALLFATVWAAYTTHAVSEVRRHIRPYRAQIVRPVSAASPTGKSFILIAPDTRAI